MRIAIVEDDKHYVDNIQRNIQQYSDEYGVNFSTDIFSDGEDIASNYKPIYEIIFFDIEMKKMDGMTAAEKIRELDKDVIIIFITNSPQYAIKGYKVDALSYLLKPVTYFAFSQELNRSIKRIEKRSTSYLIITTKAGVARLNTKDILFIESFKHRVIVHTNDETFSFFGTIKDTEKKLPDTHFARCNNCYLVNLSHVSGINDGFAFVGKHKLQISRSRKKEFLVVLTDYIGDTII